jgi:hypothetical protein
MIIHPLMGFARPSCGPRWRRLGSGARSRALLIDHSSALRMPEGPF